MVSCVAEVHELLALVLVPHDPVADRLGGLRRGRPDRLAQLPERGALVLRRRREVLSDGLGFRGYPSSVPHLPRVGAWCARPISSCETRARCVNPWRVAKRSSAAVPNGRGG